jgi:hypothetical protein
MDIKEKMEMCFNDELLNNKILTEDEKKVLASLMYSYKICRESKDNIIIRAISKLRADTGLGQDNLYEALRSLETIYGMIERIPGKRRKKGERSQATHFKLNFKTIFNPPTKIKKFDFSKELESLETSISTVDIDANVDVVVDEDVNKDKESDVIIIENENKESIIKHDDDVIFENETKVDYKKIEDDINNEEYQKKMFKKALEQQLKFTAMTVARENHLSIE